MTDDPKVKEDSDLDPNLEDGAPEAPEPRNDVVDDPDTDGGDAEAKP